MSMGNLLKRSVSSALSRRLKAQSSLALAVETPTDRYVPFVPFARRLILGFVTMNKKTPRKHLPSVQK